MSDFARLKRASGTADEPGRSAAQGPTATKRSADAALVEVSRKGPATDKAASSVAREKGAAALESRHPPCRAPWGDADIAATAENLLAWHATDPGYKVRLTVHKGWITLSGHVDWMFQRDAVEQDVRRLLGVTGVTSTIETHAHSAGSGRSDAISRAGRPDALHVLARPAR